MLTEHEPMTTIFIIGCGYTGLRVAQLALARGQLVTALARSTATQIHLQTAGITSITGDLDKPVSWHDLPTLSTTWYYFVSPPSQGVTDPRLAALFTTLKPQHFPKKVVLISTTGVYGDCGGMWIDEDQQLNPQADRAKRRVDAEITLQQWSMVHQIPIAILRVPGIYGPERLPVKRLQQQLPVLNEAISPFSNRIHVDDLARACIAAGDVGKDGIYNISDGHPTTMTDYFNQVADALGLPRPPQIDWNMAQTQLSTEMRSYLAESKRLDNRKMIEQLGIVPQYPDLASGLAQCLAHGP